jgi:hypothetical protein
MYMQRTTSGAAESGKHTAVKYVRGAAEIGLGHHDQVPATHNERQKLPQRLPSYFCAQSKHLF